MQLAFSCFRRQVGLTKGLGANREFFERIFAQVKRTGKICASAKPRGRHSYIWHKDTSCLPGRFDLF